MNKVSAQEKNRHVCENNQRSGGDDREMGEKSDVDERPEGVEIFTRCENKDEKTINVSTVCARAKNVVKKF